jgi:pimeloyl-ACP methyl ester carboxylesterase
MRRRQFCRHLAPLSIQMPGLITGGFLQAIPGDPNAPTVAEPILQKVRMGAAELHYVDIGTGEPVVFVHGSLGDYRTWGYQLEDFTEHYRMISYSRRCHYPNAWPEGEGEYSCDQHAIDLAALIEMRGYGAVHLVGQSMGALICLVLVRDRPDLVRSLSLVEPGYFPWLAETPEGAEEVARFMGEVWEPSRQLLENGETERGIRLFADAVLPGWYEKLTPEMIAVFFDNAREFTAELRSTVLLPALSATDMARIKVPTLLIDAELSPNLFHVVNDKFEQRIPNVKRVKAIGAPHAAHFATPKVFNSMVISFLERCPGA